MSPVPVENEGERSDDDEDTTNKASRSNCTEAVVELRRELLPRTLKAIQSDERQDNRGRCQAHQREASGECGPHEGVRGHCRGSHRSVGTDRRVGESENVVDKEGNARLTRRGR
jgi:hypothetical protein